MSDTYNKESFGKNLEKAIKMAGKTQASLAKEIHSSQPTISAYVHGDKTPTAETLFLMAKALNISTDYLLGLNNDDKNALNQAKTLTGFCSMIGFLYEIGNIIIEEEVAINPDPYCDDTHKEYTIRFPYKEIDAPNGPISGQWEYSYNMINIAINSMLKKLFYLYSKDEDTIPASIRQDIISLHVNEAENIILSSENTIERLKEMISEVDIDGYSDKLFDECFKCN